MEEKSAPTTPLHSNHTNALLASTTVESPEIVPRSALEVPIGIATEIRTEIEIGTKTQIAMIPVTQNLEKIATPLVMIATIVTVIENVPTEAGFIILPSTSSTLVIFATSTLAHLCLYGLPVVLWNGQCVRYSMHCVNTCLRMKKEFSRMSRMMTNCVE